MEYDQEIEHEITETIPEFINEVSLEAKLKELLRNLTSIEWKLCSDASKEFKKLLKSDSGSKLLGLYVQTSPKLSELLQAWDLRKGSFGFSELLKLITVIFSNPVGKCRSNDNGNVASAMLFVGSALDKFARIIVEEKMGDLSKELNSKEAKRQNAGLLLLASIVRRGPGLAWEIAKCFDFKMGSFTKLAQWKVRRNEGNRKNLTRKAFVGFAMSFLEVGNPRFLRGILQQKDMYSGVLRGLGNDDEETVAYVLSTLRDRVLVPESLVPPGLRSVLFGSVTLEQLISILGRVEGVLAAEVAHNVLIMVCTDPSNGLMPDLERFPSPLKGNPKRLLDLMKKLKATEIEYHKDILLAIVKGRPFFGSAYLDEFPYNVEDLASPNWFAAVSLAANVILSVGDGLAFGFVESRLLVPPPFHSPRVQDVVKCIGPRPFTRLLINKGLLNSDPLVKHATLRLVLEELKLLDSLISALNGMLSSTGQMSHKWTSLKQDIQNRVRILLPDPQVLLSLVSSLNNSNKSVISRQKRPADLEVRLENNLNHGKKLKASHDIDILVSGVHSSPPRTLDGNDGIPEEHDANQFSSDTDFVKPFLEVWGFRQCSILDAAIKDGETYFYSKLLDVLQIYHRTLPMAFEGSFDFFRILPSNPLALPTILQQSILSLLIQQVAASGKSEISIRNQPQMYKYLQSFINLFMHSPIRDIKNKAYTLAQAAMLSTGAFDVNPREISTWFIFIPGYYKNNIYVQNQEIEMFQKLSTTVTSFLCNVASTAGNNIFKYVDLMRRYIFDFVGHTEVSPSFSPFFICVLEKCLRLLGSESGALALPEKSLVSLYVSSTLKYLLGTQVEAGLLSSLIDCLLSKGLDGCCNVVGVSSDPCEWRPLKSLLRFSRSITHQEIYNYFSMVGETICTGGSLSSTLGELEKILRSEFNDGLVGISLGFSFSMICTTPSEIVQNFPLVLTMSNKLLGVPFSLLFLLFFLEPSHIAKLFELIPEVCFAAFEKLLTGVRGEGTKEDIISYEVVDSKGSASVTFSVFLERAPFHVLFPAILFVGGPYLLGHSKMQTLLLAKLSKWTPDQAIHSLCYVLFWISYARSSYRVKPSAELEKFCEFSFVLAENILKQYVVETANKDYSGHAFAPFSTHCIQEVAQIIFCHPLVRETLESPLSFGKNFEDAVFMETPESFLKLARQGVNKMDHHVLNLLKTSSKLLVPFSDYGSLPKVSLGNKGNVEGFKGLYQKLILIMKERFAACVNSGDLIHLIPTLFALHNLVDFIVPSELFELALWWFSKIDLNDVTTPLSFKTGAASVGVHIAYSAFHSLSAYMLQPNLKETEFNLHKGRENKCFDVSIFERVFSQVFEIATCFQPDVADLCLLEAIKLVKLHTLAEKTSLPLVMSISRLVMSVPISFLSHCMHKTTKTKADLLFLLSEMSPLHLSVFGHLFSDMMNKYMLFKANKMEENCNLAHSDEELFWLLPTVLLYLNSTFLKFGGQHYEHFVNFVSFLWRMLFYGFSHWKSYALQDIKCPECAPLSIEEFLNLFSGSVLGKVIFLMQHYLALNGEKKVTLEVRLSLFESICPHSSIYCVLLDCDISELDLCSLEQPLNFLNEIVAKIRLCRMLLFPEHNQLPSLLEQDGNRNQTNLKLSSSRVRFLNMLVHAWQLIIRQFQSDVGNSKQGEEANRSLLRYLEIFIANNIMELIVEMHDVLIKLDSLPFIEQLAKYALLYRFDDPATLKMLRTVLLSVSEGKFSCISILQLLLAHSQFASTLLSLPKSSDSTQFGIVFTPTSSILKSVVFPQNELNALNRKNSLHTSGLHMKHLELVKLLRVLFQIKAQQCDFHAEADTDINVRELILLLLSSYGATITEVDLEIYHLISEIESSDESVTESISEMDYLWGSAALKVRKEREEVWHRHLSNPNETEADEECRRFQYRENFPIDPKSCERTVLFFPYGRSPGQESLRKPQIYGFESLQEHAANDEKLQIYDPLFILRFSFHSLSMGYIEPLEFAGSGLLAVTFISLSSPDGVVRKLGYEVLGIFKSSLEKCQKRKDVVRLRLLLSYLQNGVIEPLQRISSVTALFVAEASFVLLDSSHDHYSAISKTLMRSPAADMKGIPLFQEFFWSNSVTFRTERLWILRLLYTALNMDDDAQIYIRNSIFEILLNFYASPLSDDESKELILQMVKKSAKLRKLTRYLVEHCGIISWFSSLVSSFDGSQCKDRQKFSFAQLTLLLEVVNDIISSRNTSKWLQKYALEQLSELSSHLYRLLVGRIEFTREQTEVVDLILQILTSTLKISLKRKVYQPHFSMSFEGLYRLSQAVDDFCGGRFSLTAEFGLKAILMSTPPVTIFDMDQEKLLKFLNWTISTAIQSNFTSAPQSTALDYNLVSFSEELSEENLIPKLLRWLTASVILGKLSSKLKIVDYSHRFEKVKLPTLQSLWQYGQNGSEENREGLGCNEMLARSIFYLQQLVGLNCKSLPSVISALCLLLFSAFSSTELNFLIGYGFPSSSLFCKIRCPDEANPAWRWSFYQPWRDRSSDPAELDNLGEIHACQMLLVAISKKLGNKSLYSQFRSQKDVENFDVFKWERSIIESK